MFVKGQKPPQDHKTSPRKHRGPEINADQGGVEPPTIELAAILGRTQAAKTTPHPLGYWSCGKKGTYPQKAPAPTTPQHMKEKERPRHFRLLPHVGAEKLARAIQHTAVARNRAALATSLLVDTLADKQVAACMPSQCQSCKANGVSSRLKL